MAFMTGFFGMVAFIFSVIFPGMFLFRVLLFICVLSAFFGVSALI
ncbi:hypothetical protein [Haliea sp.]|nr:hypothetical protein [Haliea sp.]